MDMYGTVLYPEGDGGADQWAKVFKSVKSLISRFLSLLLTGLDRMLESYNILNQELGQQLQKLLYATTFRKVEDISWIKFKAKTGRRRFTLSKCMGF